MSFGLKISEACSLALHTMVLMQTDSNRIFSNDEIADKLHVSKNHLSKVLQRLVKSELVESVRGPKGGYRLVNNRKNITLLEVYEAIEGPLKPGNCLAESPICDGTGCIFRGKLEKLNSELKDYMINTNLTELTDIYGREL